MLNKDKYYNALKENSDQLNGRTEYKSLYGRCNPNCIRFLGISTSNTFTITCW